MVKGIYHLDLQQHEILCIVIVQVDVVMLICSLDFTINDVT